MGQYPGVFLTIKRSLMHTAHLFCPGQIQDKIINQYNIIVVMNNIRLVLSDYDRTFTDETLCVVPGLVDVIRRLKEKGVLFSIVSGRKYSFMLNLYRDMGGLVDAFVAENGCVGYAHGQKHMISGVAGDREALLCQLTHHNIPYDAGDVVVSVNHVYGTEVDQIMQAFPGLHIVKNIDSLMLLPRGASKATGVKWLMGVYHLTPGNMACIGDAENDVDMRGFCKIMGAVSNALPIVKGESDYICRGSFGTGVREFLEYIEGQRS